MKRSWSKECCFFVESKWIKFYLFKCILLLYQSVFRVFLWCCSIVMVLTWTDLFIFPRKKWTKDKINFYLLSWCLFVEYFHHSQLMRMHLETKPHRLQKNDANVMLCVCLAKIRNKSKQNLVLNSISFEIYRKNKLFAFVSIGRVRIESRCI